MRDDKPIGLPPAKDAAPPAPSSRTTLLARLVNLFGLISPASNLGLVFVAPRSRRWFGLAAGFVCTIAFLYGWSGERPAIWRTALVVHYALVVAGLVHPLAVAAVARAWAAFGTVLGKVMAYPVFTVIYIVAVTPTALVARALGKDPLGTRGPPRDSYWTPHAPPPKERYERQF
jgi:hypothetical protein